METPDRRAGSSRRIVLQGLSLTGLAVAGGVGAAAAPGSGFDYRRWWTGDYRIVQTNLREIDVRENPREIARAIKDFGGNVVISNIGGIVAFYPTGLELQYRNPYLKGDFVKDMIEAAHAEGLAYVGRFDLSKAMQAAYAAHPDWFMLDRDGAPRTYEGSYQACPNGDWAQDYGLRILREALSRYKPDGVFFNMVGYPPTDYSNVNHGICVCDNCRRAFRAVSGRDLPRADGFSDPAWRDYLAFQEQTSRALALKVEKAVAPLIPGVPITRSDDYDVVGRGEVQRRVDRPAPEWAYQAGEQGRVALARNPGKPWSSTSTAHVDYPWRQVTETAAYHQLRFAQMLGIGAKLDLYLMGTLADQDDQTWLPPLSELYKWQAANSARYAGMTQAARVGLYHSQSTERLGGMTPYRAYQTGSFRGAYSALVDSRIPFQVVSDKRVADGTARLSETYDVIIAPNVMLMSAGEAAALDKFVEAGGLLIASGMTAGFDTRAERVSAIPLASFPLQSYGVPERVKGWTLDPAKSELKVTGRVPVDAFYFGGALKAGAANLMGFAPDQRFGPPEFSYAVPGSGVRASPGVTAFAYGKGHAVHIPWFIEWHYYRDGLPVHQQLMASLIARYAPAQACTLAGEGAVELMYLRRGSAGPMLLHVVNYAGQRNTLYAPAPHLHGLRLGVRGAASGNAQALVAGQSLKGAPDAGDPGLTWFELPPVGPFEAIAVEA
jgi:hypothetical protein